MVWHVAGVDGSDVADVDGCDPHAPTLEQARRRIREALAFRLGAVVIGRPLHEDYRDNAERLKALPRQPAR